MKKKFLKIAVASMVLGAGGGAIYKQATEINTASASSTTVQKGESFETIQTSDDKNLYKEFSSKIKLPKKVELVEGDLQKNNKNKTRSLSMLDSGEALVTENKADSFTETDIREYVRSKEYVHQYYGNKKNQNITFQVFDEKVDLYVGSKEELEQGLITKKEVTLKNGIKATFADGADRNVLHFYDEDSDLTYLISGWKKNGKFKEKDLLDIANSMF
jgi:hypothetical protein